jgi:hypothetical protein
MLCSRCSERIRPVVAVDIDGTLADYHGHFELFAQSWLGVGEPSSGLYDGTEPFRDWFCRVYKVDVTTFRTIKLAYRQGGMKRTQPLMFGAPKLISTLARHAEVWLTTTRPHDRYDRVDPDTRSWLERNRIVGYSGLLFNDEKMMELKDRVDRSRVVAVLDDDPEILEDARVLGLGATILNRNQYNTGVEWPTVAEGLDDALSQIALLIEGWTRKNG